MNLSQISENIIQIKKTGQVIIPVKLRQFYPWLTQDNLIEAKPTANGLLLQPLETPTQTEGRTAKKTAKELLKEFAKLARNDKNPDVNLTEFIIKDRESH